MSASCRKITVSETPVPLNIENVGGAYLVIKTVHDVYLGAEDVSSERGYKLEKQDGPLYVELGPDEVLYAISADGTEFLVYVLLTKCKWQR